MLHTPSTVAGSVCACMPTGLSMHLISNSSNVRKLKESDVDANNALHKVKNGTNVAAHAVVHVCGSVSPHAVATSDVCSARTSLEHVLLVGSLLLGDGGLGATA